MSNGSGPKDSIAPAEYTVFLDPKQWHLAESYYKMFASDGSRKVGARSVYFGGDVLSLLKMIASTNSAYILIVTHAWEKGVYMHLAPPAKKAYKPAIAGRTALSLLLVIQLLRAGMETIDKKPKDQQTVAEWQTLNNRRMRFSDLANQDPLGALQAAQKLDLLGAKPELEDTDLDSAELEFRKNELGGKPGDHSKEVQALEKQIHEIDVTQKKKEEEKKDAQRKQINEWIDLQITSALKLHKSDLESILAAITAVQAVQLKDVQIRGCNLGEDKDAMQILRLFLGAAKLEAPKVKTAYGDIPVQIESHSLAPHRVCKPTELLRRSGCWWPYDDGDFEIFIKHAKHHHLVGQAFAVSKMEKDKWVKDHLGPPRSKLGDSIPFHLLDTAPPAFPLDPEFEDNLESVSGLSE